MAQRTLRRSSTRLSGNTSRADTSPNNSFNSDDSDTTVDLDYSNVIEINETQQPPAHIDDEDDDDSVILIPQHIETIDLCSQPSIPFRLPFAPNEIIEVEDSPVAQRSGGDLSAGPSRNNRRGRSASSPYVVPAPKTSKKKQLKLDDSSDESDKLVRITCPICFESIVNRKPVSTSCGHLFCRKCITRALSNVKKCPMCQKSLKSNNLLNIFLGV
jgi:hypothetical protein